MTRESADEGARSCGAGTRVGRGHRRDLQRQRRGDGRLLWFGPPTAGGSAFQIYLGDSTDVPAPGDYDGDGKTDAVIFRYQ